MDEHYSETWILILSNGIEVARVAADNLTPDQVAWIYETAETGGRECRMERRKS